MYIVNKIENIHIFDTFDSLSNFSIYYQGDLLEKVNLNFWRSNLQLSYLSL